MPGRLPLGLLIVVGIFSVALWLHETRVTGAAPQDLKLRPLQPAPRLADAASPIEPIQLAAADDSPVDRGVRSTNVSLQQAVNSPSIPSPADGHIGWTAAAQSTAGGDLLVQPLGDGIQRVLIVAAIDGRDASAPELMDRLATELRRRHELLQANSFFLVRALNPDGLIVGQRGNGRDISLDFNFPTPAFEVSPALKTGSGPASEVETRFMLKTLAEFRPHRLVQIRTDGSLTAPRLRTNDRAERLATALAADSVERESLGVEQRHGSLEEYADVTLQCESVVLQVPAYSNIDITWQRARGTLLDVLAFDPAARRLQELRSQQREPLDNLLDSPVANSRQPKPVPHPRPRMQSRPN